MPFFRILLCCSCIRERVPVSGYQLFDRKCTVYMQGLSGKTTGTCYCNKSYGNKGPQIKPRPYQRIQQINEKVDTSRFFFLVKVCIYSLIRLHNFMNSRNLTQPKKKYLVIPLGAFLWLNRFKKVASIFFSSLRPVQRNFKV